MQSRVILLILFYSQIACFGQIRSDLNKLLPSNNGNIITHNNFILSYLDKCKQSECVIYKLTDQIGKKLLPRRVIRSIQLHLFLLQDCLVSKHLQEKMRYQLHLSQL